MSNCHIRVEIMDTGRVFEMETEDCWINLEHGIKDATIEANRFYFETGYYTITIQAHKVIAKEMLPKYFKTEETRLEPYMEVW